MNIYLDIHGVLVKGGKAAPGADELIAAALHKYPGHVYWLSTHNWRGDNNAPEVLAPVLRPETGPLLYQVKPAGWDTHKTDGIDFGQPFLWLDDNLGDEDLRVLRSHGALDSFVHVDLIRNPEQLRQITQKYLS